MSHLWKAPVAAVSAAALAVSGCGGGGSGGGGGAPPPPPPPGPNQLYSVPAQESLSAAEVERILAHGIAEAQARSLPAVISVTDRVGNVLAVFNMAGAAPTALTREAPSGNNTDAQGVTIPAEAGAIAKAITGAYLSSGGNAFSTRTASMIVQQHFPPSPATAGLESGPLFGVQFSQLPCSDLNTRFVMGGGAGAFIGPKRSPLGLSADPGGFPLYKNGVLVGGVGVMADGDYGFDDNVLDVDADGEEAIALAASFGFEPPATIRADRITVDGTSLRYSDMTSAGLASNPANAPAFSLAAGVLPAVTGYFAGGAVLAGQAYGAEASGVRAASPAEFDDPDAFILTNGAGANRFPPTAGTAADGIAAPLTQAETTEILHQAFDIMSRGRAQIRRPLDSRMQVSIAVVDANGEILGVVRSPDAPVFGIDLAVQKARTVNFFSHSQAASDLLGDPSAEVNGFVAAARTFLNDPIFLTGQHAFAERSVGNLSRPHFPDGEVARPNGPFSRPIGDWSPLSTGLQSALIIGNIGQHLTFVTGGGADTAPRCTFLPDAAPGLNRMQNGSQSFPGGVPIYRNGVLVGGIGVSGDGIDQDDMVSFLGLHNAGLELGTGIQNAPAPIRADQIVVAIPGANVRLRYINCPFAPFLDTSEQNVCEGK
jgi:uncharacterized protein GlcG (DUF336 family)